MWNYELSGKSQNNCTRSEIRIHRNPQTATALGFLSHPFFIGAETIALDDLELIPGVSWNEGTACSNPLSLADRRNTGSPKQEDPDLIWFLVR